MATVTVEQGKLKGGLGITNNGVQYYEFLCVPYAKPPVGNLRFKSPQPAESWSGEKDATIMNEKNIALQMDKRIDRVIGSEDCLYLNVYTPKIHGNQTDLLPVMFFIHGGGFVIGNGIDKNEYGPDYLVEKDVVVVTINYRLNIFGFLSLDIPEAAGNMGLKDQVEALKWVQKNIRHFGGDSSNITIFGISAGSASVEFLLMAPFTEGLFHKAIMQSGSTINHWAINYEQRKLINLILEDMGYKGSFNNEKEIYEFLMEASEEELVDVAQSAAAKHITSRLYNGFCPTIEKDLGNGDAFITEYPYRLLKAGKFQRIPVIKGFCNKEGYLTCTIMPATVSELTSKKQFYTPYAFEIEAEDKKNLCEEISEAYKTSEEEDKIGEEFFSDFDFISGILISGEIMADFGTPVYFYEISYDGNVNFLKRLLGIKKEGAAHADDTSFIFKHNVFSKFAEERDVKFIASITKMWTDFAKTGVPTTKDSAIDWPAYTTVAPVYLNFDETLSIKSNYGPNKLAAFKKIYEKYEM